MRINQFIARAHGLSRRAADKAIAEGRVQVNGQRATLGARIEEDDQVTLDGQVLQEPSTNVTLMLHKPVGYVCSRNGQGSPTIYELLPEKYHTLKPVGRLDKDSSGLLLLTNDGELANQLTHPRYVKQKVYEITLDRPLTSVDKSKIEQGVQVDNYVSRMRLVPIENSQRKTVNGSWCVTMSMGHNRQIRRTFAAVGYAVTSLHRSQFGPYEIQNLKSGSFIEQ